MSDIKFEIIKKIGVLSTTASGWEKQLNLMSWNDREPKYDIREWSSGWGEDGERGDAVEGGIAETKGIVEFC